MRTSTPKTRLMTCVTGVIFAVSTISSSVCAQDRPQVELLPKPLWEERDDAAVMDYENARLLLRLYAQYQFLHTVYVLDNRLIAELTTARAAASESSAFWKGEVVAMRTQRDAALRAAEESEAWSITGGALPWAVAAVIVSGLVGGYVGYRVSR